MMEWWKHPMYAQVFGGSSQSPQQRIQAMEMQQIQRPQQAQGFSQKMGASNNSARAAIGGGAMNAALDKQNKMASQMQQSQPIGYTGAGPNQMVEPSKRVGSADVHEGEFVLNADATQAIGPDILQGMQQAANAGTIDVNALRSAIGQPEQQGYAIGGLVGPITSRVIGGIKQAEDLKTNTTQQLNEIVNPTRVIGGQTNVTQAGGDTLKPLQQQTVSPNTQQSVVRGTNTTSVIPQKITAIDPNQVAAEERAKKAAEYEAIGMQKLADVATGKDALYDYQRNALMQDIGAAGAAGVAAARQQAAQAGMSAEQAQSMGMQQQRKNLATQSGELTDLSSRQQQMAIGAAESLQGRALQTRQYDEGAEQRALTNDSIRQKLNQSEQLFPLELQRLTNNLKMDDIDLDTAQVGLDVLKQNQFGTEFLNAMQIAKNSGMTNEQAMNSAAVKAAWAKMAPTLGMDPNDMTSLGAYAKVAGMSEVETVLNNADKAGVFANMDPKAAQAFKDYVKQVYMFGGSLEKVGADGWAINVGGTKTTLIPPTTTGAADYADATKTPNTAIPQLINATGQASDFWTQSGSHTKTQTAVRNLLATGKTPEQVNAIATEIMQYYANPSAKISEDTKTLLRQSGEKFVVQNNITQNGVQLTGKEAIDLIKAGDLTPLDSVNAIGIDLGQGGRENPGGSKNSYTAFAGKATLAAEKGKLFYAKGHKSPVYFTGETDIGTYDGVSGVEGAKDRLERPIVASIEPDGTIKYFALMSDGGIKEIQ